MEVSADIVMPRPLLPDEPIEEAVFCGECEKYQQDKIGDNCGSCGGMGKFESVTPMKCMYYNNAHSIVSILVFLKGSGLSIYNRAIVEDFEKQIDPGLVSSFLQAIGSFGKELTGEQVSLIQFQKMKIVFCRGKYINGALILKGEFDDAAQNVFSEFISRVENSYPEYLNGNLMGKCLPESEVDGMCFESLREYARGKLYSVDDKIVEKSCKIGCRLGRK